MRREKASKLVGEKKHEANAILLFVLGLATLVYTWQTHKGIHAKIKERGGRLRLDDVCRGDDCGLELNKVEITKITSLVDDAHMAKISKLRSENCSSHGFQDRDGECQCPVLYKGTDCSKSYNFLVRLPNAWKLQAEKVFSTRSFSGQYDGKFVMSQQGFPHAKEKRHVYEQVKIEKYKLLGDGSVQRRREVIGFVDNELYEVLPERDPLRERVFNRCAVVGSSGVLLNRRGGEIIDNYHMVLRLNTAPTTGFERQVGGKTTLRLVHVDDLMFSEGNESVVVTGLSRDMLRDRKWFAGKGFGRKNRLFLLDPEFENYVARSAVEFTPSDGMLGALLALQVCRVVHLYGFFVWERYGSSPYHYYDTCGRQESEDLDRQEDLEWRFLKSLVQGRLLSFGETCVLECRESEDACDQCRQNDPTFEPLVPGDLVELRRRRPKPDCVESDIDFETQAPL